MFNYVHCLVKAATLIFGICASLQSRVAGMAVITRVYVTSRLVRKCLQSLKFLLGLNHPVSISVLGEVDRGGSRAVVERFPENFLIIH